MHLCECVFMYIYLRAAAEDLRQGALSVPMSLFCAVFYSYSGSTREAVSDNKTTTTAGSCP